MSEPKVGEYLFAAKLLATEARSRKHDAPTWWPPVFSIAVVTAFLYFLLM